MRIARPGNRGILENGVYWSRLLRPKGVPLPQVLGQEFPEAVDRFAYVILHRLPGRDLGLVYSHLKENEKRRIVADLVRIQKIVATLPQGHGFGHVARYDGSYPYPCWSAVVRGSLQRSHKRLERSGRVDVSVVGLVEKRSEQFEAYFDHIQPVPFLDDITTKNVIVHEGKLSGIVDVDWMGFGDSIVTLALTRMSLLELGYSTDYVEFWAEELKLSGEQHRVLDIYAAACCLDFISDATSERKVQRLQAILKHLLTEL